jgi:hypothetical integral membrane protein (TIGR02206 family)
MLSFSELTDFKAFGTMHLLAIAGTASIIALWIYAGRKAETETSRKHIRIFFAVFIILVRSARYVMDIAFDRFDIADLLSLHICHIDLILLAACLIRPNKWIFSFNFLVGIPMGLAVALFPGSTHPIPGKLRAVFFIASHLMLAGGAVYLAVVERMKVHRPHLYTICSAGLAGTVLIYFVNKIADTNYLYLMEAPEGTVIEGLESIFGYPGYVFIMMAIAFLCIMLFYLLSKAISRSSEPGPP